MENRNGHDCKTKYFVGVEVEKSPAYADRTLFVVGLQEEKEVIAEALKNKCHHIYLGANQSFNPPIEGTKDWLEWGKLICALVQYAKWVTLDFDSTYIKVRCQDIQEWCKYDNFIPMISVKVPHIEQLNENTTIKIDDIGFRKTNVGIWCHRLNELTANENITHWEEYDNDIVIPQ